ncbi:hypothetical protein G7Y89_g9564 [Cudoniella acicularis]|uniref:Tail specific protease domain-containing protein n=1 Tax=Cudoniella acicularis TaxID=354080 RepID=A0A8H4VZX1_9HELO|nr:hypothetical protein G7Y89_g9564 [Cudoniella acicularis]
MLLPTSLITLSIVLAGFAQTVAAECEADNCLRALRATPTLGRVAARSATTGGACASVSALSSAQKVISPSATPTVPASLAHDCLNSVPLNKTAALLLVDAMEPYLEWQSDSAWKKDPPADYFYPPHDIFGYLALVKKNLESDQYANEYEFQEDLYNVFALAHDGHFVFYPDALTKAFEWGRQRSLVSISKDGVEIPQIYLYEDIISAPSSASIVKEINGEDAATYVANFAYTASFNQDADAAYNSMFYSKAYFASGNFKGYFSGGGRMRYIYPGANTTFTFENGTILSLNNIANVKGNFASVTDGPSFYNQFCTGPKATTSTSSAAPAPGVPGYPTPIIVTNDSVVSGYYLTTPGYEDVAVLSLLAFESESPLEFQQVAQQFIASALAAGKTKLVIDLSANGGGYILQGYDMFRQLFPSIIQDGYSRWRENDMLLAISKIYSDSIPTSYNPANASSNTISIYENFFNYRYDYNISDLPFPSYSAKFGPNYFRGDAFTAITRWNLDDQLTTSNDTYGMGMDITGYGSRTNFTQPFKAENIIMLMDGYCASTCTLFAEFMRLQGNVKTVAIGGRPSTSAIQGVGGIKGAQILGWPDIYAQAQVALSLPGVNITAEQTKALQRLKKVPLDRRWYASAVCERGGRL